MTEEEKVKDSPGFKKFLIISVCLLLVFFAVLYYIKYLIPEKPKYETLTYNNFEFKKIDNVWFTDWQRGEQPYNLAFRYSPLEAGNVSHKGWINESFNQGSLYITFDLTEDESKDNAFMALAASELALTAVRAMNRT